MSHGLYDWEGWEHGLPEDLSLLCEDETPFLINVAHERISLCEVEDELAAEARAGLVAIGVRVEPRSCLTIDVVERGIPSPAVLPDGVRAIVAAPGEPLAIWHLRTGERLKQLGEDSKAAQRLVLHPDGQRVLAACDDFALRVWDVYSGRCLPTLEGHYNTINALALGPNGVWAVSASADTNLRVWDLQTGACVKVLYSHDDDVNDVAVTTDGALAISASDDCSLIVWDARTWERVWTLKGHGDNGRGVGYVAAVAVLPGTMRAVSGGTFDGALRVWDLAAGQCVRTIEVPCRSLQGLGVTPDGTRVLSGHGDNGLRVWDLETGECLEILDGQVEPTYIALTPDGRFAVSGGLGGDIYVWDLAENAPST